MVAALAALPAVAWSAAPVAATAAGVAGSPVRPQTADTPAEEARLLKQVQDSLDRKKSLDAKVAELDTQLRETQNNLFNAQNKLSTLVVRQKGMEAQLEVVRGQLDAARDDLRDQAIAAYTGGNRGGGGLSDLLRMSDVGQLAAKQSYLRAVSATQSDLILSTERLRDRSSDLLEELGSTRAKTEEERSRVAAEERRLRSERDTQAAVRHQISVEIANHAGVLKEVVDRQDEFEAQARELEAQSSAIAEQLQIRQRESSSSSSSRSSSSSSSSSGFGGPLASIRVSSAFGWRIHPIYGSARLHTGVDLSASSGTPIRAAADGVVASAGWLGGYGNAVVIDHGGGQATLYAHQSSMAVRQGQSVDKGDVIGRVGCTGSCTGPHLHYEVRLNGKPVDPSPYL
ncbi:MAG TPA: peptidoglycan DD-metalloendopeptidase family protein [Acidimicrobiales bacterium]